MHVYDCITPVDHLLYPVVIYRKCLWEQLTSHGSLMLLNSTYLKANNGKCCVGVVPFNVVEVVCLPMVILVH